MAENNNRNANDIAKVAADEIAQLRGIMENSIREELKQAAASVFMMFREFVAAGFTEAQALKLVSSIMTGGKNENKHN